MSKMYKILMSAKDDIIKELKSGDIDVGALAKIMIRAFKDEVEFGTVTEEYLHKYTTKDLLGMLDKSMDDNGFEDESRSHLILNIINLLYLRQREYRAITGDTNLKPNPDDVDRILFPPKPPKRRPKALPESEFQIDNWDELLIEISDGSGRIGFKKIFDGKPSFESAYSRHYSELGFGQKSIEFLHICATANKTGSFSYQNRRQKSRVDNALREHFNMGKTESIVRHPTKKQNYIPLFRIWHYDKDGNSTY